MFESRSLRIFGLAMISAVLFFMLSSAPAQAAREYQCEITGLKTGPADECNGAGNDIPGGQLLSPQGIAADGASNIWISDFAGSRVMKFDSAGNFLAENNGSADWSSAGGLSDLAFGSTANLIYGVQGPSGDIWKIALDATSPGRLVTGGGFISGFADAAVDNSSGPHAGDVYVGYQGGYVARYKPDGSADEFAAGQAYNVENRIVGTPTRLEALNTFDIAVDPDGDLYVLAGNAEFQSEIQRFDPSGNFVRSYTGYPSANKIAIDPTSGNILLYDPPGTPESEGPVIWELDAGGTRLREITGKNSISANDQIGAVNEMSVGPDGRLYLSGEPAVRLLSPADPLPRITYGPETDPTRTEIDVHATVDPNGAGDITSCKVEYGITYSYEAGSVPCVPSPAPKFTTPTAVSAHLSGLQAEDEYHYRVVVENAAGVRRGDGRSFKLTAVDDVTTGGATDVTTSSATLTGTYSDDGPAAKYFFEYGNTPALGQRFPLAPGADAAGGGGTVPVSSQLTGLQEGTTYYYRVAVSTVFGTSRGGIESFKTLQKPTIESFSANEVTDTSANLIGRINPNGFATTYRFEYGQTPDYGQTAPVPDGTLEALTTVQSVNIPIDGLVSGSTYHFRLVAESVQGTTTTEDQTFDFFPPDCPNAQVRLETNSSYLPDCRAYELVSPGDAGGILLTWSAPPASSATQPARFGYSGVFGVLPGDVGLPPNVLGDLYVAERTTSGWKTKYVGLPSNMVLEQGGPPSSGPGRPGGVLTDPSLSNFMVWNTGTIGYVCPCSEGSMAPYILDPTGSIIERLPSNLDQVPGGVDFKGDVKPSSDFSHVFFSSRGPAFVEGAPVAEPGAAYDDNRETGEVELISTAPGGGGPVLKDPEAPESGDFIRFPAVSPNGSHVLMSTAAATGRHLYMHSGGGTVDVSLGKDGKNHGVEFNGMTGDGSEVLFSSREQLTDDDHDSSQDIFAWHEGGTVTRISAGILGTGDTDECDTKWTTKCDASVVTISPVGGPIGLEVTSDNIFSDSNGEVYFYSPEQLDGVRGLLGKRNLYVYHEGQVQHVATLEVEKEPFEPTRALTRIQVSPTNEHAAIVTNSRITSYDNHGFAEMYSYDVDQRKLICVSCVPSGDAPTANVTASYNGLFMSDDGRTFFATKDSLVDRDINGLRDTYEYVGGRPQLITTGLATRDTGLQGYFVAGLVGVSHDGVNVFIANYETLVSEDHNGQFLRFYDARSGGGFPADAPPAPCAAADECHGADSSPPVAPEITSGAKLGTGGNAATEKHKKPKKCTKQQKKKKKKGCKGAKKKAGKRRASR
jgi:hypothetical protein